MIVSFDWDQTITEHPELAQLASSLQATGHQTVILTGRKTDAGIRELLQEAGFPEDTEIITKAGHDGTIRDFKSKKLQEMGVDIHFDNVSLDLPDWHPTKVLTFQKSSIKFGKVSM